jgi:hypothetical protein
MRLPPFTAEASLYASAHIYGIPRRGQAAGTEALIAPQESFVCDGAHCGCHGFDDCFDCWVTGSCVGTCHISGQTWICEDGNP